MADEWTDSEQFEPSQSESPFRNFDDGEEEMLLGEDFSWEDTEDELQLEEEEGEDEALDEMELEEENEAEEEAEWATEVDYESDVAFELEEFMPEVEEAFLESSELRSRDNPALRVLAERVAGATAVRFQQEAPRARMTRRFTSADIQRVRTVYRANFAARQRNANDSNSCIVMLNVGLGQLLKLPLKETYSRGGRNRTTGARLTNRKVKMAKLTTDTIEKAIGQLRARRYALKPIEIEFLDARGRRAGTTPPDRLQRSVSARVLALSRPAGYWYAYSMSIMDGYHSVLLLVDSTGTNKRIYWLDQFSDDVRLDVASRLDTMLTESTKRYWQTFKANNKKGYTSNTTVRLWPLQKRAGS
jgi:hypothetical protein